MDETSDHVRRTLLQSPWLQLYHSATIPPSSMPSHLLRFYNDHATHEDGSSGGSVSNRDDTGDNPENQHCFEIVEAGCREANGDVLVDPTPRKGARKRGRHRNWTDEETSVLVKCKELAFHDTASPFCKPKSSATDWEAISKAVRNNPDTRASEKTGAQCRLRWDTLVKSHRIIKEHCMRAGKEYAELGEEEISGLKLATALKEEWYEVIDAVASKTRSRKRDNPRGVGDWTDHDSGIGNGADPVSPRIAPTYQGSPRLFSGWSMSASVAISPPCSPPLLLSTRRPEPWKLSRKQIAIPGFSRLPGHLRSTLLDLILGRRFLGRRLDDERLSWCCRWLSIIQNRSLSDIYDDVTVLVKMELVHISPYENVLRIEGSRFRVFDKFMKKVIRSIPIYDIHRHFKLLDDTKFISARDFSVPERIRVLKLDRCLQLRKVDFRGLRRLRSLYIIECQVLEEAIGWKFLRELGWLDIDCCSSYRDYPDLQSLPSLKEFRFNRDSISDGPRRSDLGVSPCVRLRRLEIWEDGFLEESGDLSSLKCLEVLSFDGCRTLSTIAGLRGLHSLTSLSVASCLALRMLPDLSHMKELACIDIRRTHLEEIPGVEKLVSLKTLDCRHSKLKHLPDLHHLLALQKVYLAETPLTENDPSSFYFDKAEVLFNPEETRHVDVSDISDAEHGLSSSYDDDEEERIGLNYMGSHVHRLCA